MTTCELVILQPYVPEYRVPIFDAMVALLNGEGTDCRRVVSQAEGDQLARGDAAAVEYPWLVHANRRRLQMVGRRSSWLSFDGDVVERADGVIVGLTGFSIDVHRALGHHLRRGSGLVCGGTAAATSYAFTSSTSPSRGG